MNVPFARIALLCALSLLLVPSACRSSRTSEGQSSFLPPASNVKKVTLAAGDTLSVSLRKIELPASACEEIIASINKIFNPRSCREGDYYEIICDDALGWAQFTYYPSGLEFFQLKKSSAGIETEQKTRTVTRQTLSARGIIQNSLWESMSTRQIPPDIIMHFADIFAWKIDFLTETRDGDSFKVVYERDIADNGVSVGARILTAQYTASGKDCTAMLFTDSNGRADYYTPEGTSVRSAFLRAPLQFRRISSYFSRRRFHPVLKKYRAHLGIDYAAPTGTPVSSIGDGAVIFAARKGGFGNLVKVRHSNGYISQYGHLSRYGKNVRAGRHVSQGQVIGYVGSTGLSTGPHLDFRVVRNGVFINYLSLKFPADRKIEARDSERFRRAKVSSFTQLAGIN